MQQSKITNGQSSKSTDPDEGWLLVGRITGVHGVRGELRIESLSDYPERFAQGNRVFLGPERRPATILSTGRSRGVLLRLEGCDSRTEAERLRGVELWIPRADAMPLAPGEYLLDDIVGLSVVDEDGESIGQVVEVLRTGANDVYVVRNAEREILIPAINDVVRTLDPEHGRLVIVRLKGLLD